MKSSWQHNTLNPMQDLNSPLSNITTYFIKANDTRFDYHQITYHHHHWHRRRHCCSSDIKDIDDYFKWEFLFFQLPNVPCPPKYVSPRAESRSVLHGTCLRVQHPDWVIHRLWHHQRQRRRYVQGQKPFFSCAIIIFAGLGWGQVAMTTVSQWVCVVCWMSGLHVTETRPQGGETCQDVLVDCAHYGVDACSQYTSWARNNCAKFCGLCSEYFTSATHAFPSSASSALPHTPNSFSFPINTN